MSEVSGVNGWLKQGERMSEALRVNSAGQWSNVSEIVEALDYSNNNSLLAALK